MDSLDTNIATSEQLLSDAQHSLVWSWLLNFACLRNLQILCCSVDHGSRLRGIIFPLNRDQMNKITINNGVCNIECCDRAFVPRRIISHPLIITNSREIHIFVEFDCNIMDCNRSLRDGHALLSYINIPSSSCNFQGFLLTRENLLKDRNLGSQQVSLALIPVIVLTSLSEIKKRNNFNEKGGGQLVKWFQFKDWEMDESFNYNQLVVTRGFFTLHHRYSDVC